MQQSALFQSQMRSWRIDPGASHLFGANIWRMFSARIDLVRLGGWLFWAVATTFVA
jgi:hypothetical protein